ncbi:SRPBCC family protein [Streptomyces sp. NBC_00376]|uniref:SRPBCC family protein n=1 Tax=Streptomyces sp. NBC_00376 TaxID=2975730 RepID=UPI003FCEBFB0
MKPVTVSIDVPQTPEQAYGFLDVMTHHERFTNHYLTDWHYSGPGRGIGSCATVTAALGGTKTDVTIEVVEADPPRRIVERNVSAAGRRLARGTYTIERLRTGGSRVSFKYTWARARSPTACWRPSSGPPCGAPTVRSCGAWPPSWIATCPLPDPEPVLVGSSVLCRTREPGRPCPHPGPDYPSRFLFMTGSTFFGSWRSKPGGMPVAPDTGPWATSKALIVCPKHYEPLGQLLAVRYTIEVGPCRAGGSAGG